MRYIVFKYSKYESEGGARDYWFSANTSQEIKCRLVKDLICNALHYNNYLEINILDTTTNVILGGYDIDTMLKSNINKKEYILNIIDEICNDVENKK